jgi:uncharacterized protein YodC (DUF2158 family)
VIGLSSHSGNLCAASINAEGKIMDLKPGDVVILKSGGHPITVAEVGGDTIVGVWMGGEGDLFRETLPMAVLELAEIEVSDEEGEEEGEEDDESDQAA